MSDSKYIGAEETARDLLENARRELDDVIAQLAVAGILDADIEKHIERAKAELLDAQAAI